MDLTSLWVALYNHRSRLVLFALGVLIFAAGWQTGRVASPYYVAHPIIFEEQKCESCPSAGGSRGELTELQQQGTAAAAAQQEKPVEQLAPAVAGAVSTTKQGGQFVGSVNSDLYHALGCPSVSRIKAENQVWFASAEEAEAAGYSPSKCTKEKLGI